MKKYRVICKLCGKIRYTEYPEQEFCSRQCSGKYNIKKRIYKKRKCAKLNKKGSFEKYIGTKGKTSRTYTDTINKGCFQTSRRAVKFPATEFELFTCILAGDIISRPAMVKVIKGMEGYKRFLENFKKLKK